MRIVPLTLAAWLAALSWAAAQVTVEVLLEDERYLRDESLPVKVRITNRSGQTLQLGQEPDWLTFTLESRDGYIVAKQGEVPVTGAFTLESSQVATRRADLMPYFELDKPGRYLVSANLKIKQWAKELSSAPKGFEIVRGAKLWEQEFGVPGGDQPPEARKYILQQARRLKQLQLYARVTDLSENRVFRVMAIGPLVSFSRPEAQVDKASNLHVLFQTSARSFNYAVISPDGELIARERHDYAKTRPALRGRDDGTIFVNGGVRHRMPDDLPPSAASVATNEVPTATP